jgi:hypothetical protein
MVTDTPVVKEIVVAVVAVCYLCGDVISVESDCPLCSACELDQQQKLADYRADQEQKRNPV